VGVEVGGRGVKVGVKVGVEVGVGVSVGVGVGVGVGRGVSVGVEVGVGVKVGVGVSVGGGTTVAMVAGSLLLMITFNVLDVWAGSLLTVMCNSPVLSTVIVVSATPSTVVTYFEGDSTDSAG
jgi:hypothetical protein